MSGKRINKIRLKTSSPTLGTIPPKFHLGISKAVRDIEGLKIGRKKEKKEKKRYNHNRLHLSVQPKNTNCLFTEPQKDHSVLKKSEVQIHDCLERIKPSTTQD